MGGIEKMARKLCVSFKDVLLFVVTFILITVIVKQWPYNQKRYIQKDKSTIINKNIFTVPRPDIVNFPKEKSPRFNLDQDLFDGHGRLYARETKTKIVIKKPGINKPHPGWQLVDNSKELFVFSAYFYQPENMIRVVGIGLRNKQFQVKCVFKQDDKSEDGTVWGNVTEIGEHHEKRYTALFVLCPLPKNKPRPSTVSIKDIVVDQEPQNILRIAYNDKFLKSRNISVCIPPLHSGYNKVKEFVQSIEMNQILGASKIFIYKERISSSVQHVLNYYQRAGSVDVVEWNTPVADSKLIHYHGQMAFIHDCWLRNRGLFQFVAFNDLDELIIPYKHKDWHQMLSSHLSKDPNIGSFMFKNSYFYKQREVDFTGLALNETRDIKDFNLHMMALVWRENKVWKYNQRSKFILMPTRINNIGIHRVYGHLKGFKEVVVDPKVAILHHYKGVKPPKDTEKGVRDVSARKYNKQLTKRVKLLYRNTEHIK